MLSENHCPLPPRARSPPPTQHNCPLHITAHISVTACQEDPHPGWWRNHRPATTVNTRRSAPLSTCASTHTLTPPGSAISIVPPAR